MGIAYKILWVDDGIDDFKDLDIVTDIETFLKDLGFVPEIICLEDIVSAEEKLKEIKFDLILSDFNIEGEKNKNGDTLIKKIREGEIYTEVLFYSAQSDIEALAQALRVDRISFHHITTEERGYQDFVKKTKWLIEQSVEKLQEIESIRGLVMSETSQLDAFIKDILTSFFKSDSTNKKTLRTYIIKKIKGSVGSNFEKGEKCDLKECDLKISSKENDKLLEDRLFDAYKKAMALDKMLRLENNSPEKFDHEDYCNKVINVRNDLAHAKSKIEHGKEYLMLSRDNDEVPMEFNNDVAVGIRKDLTCYSDLLGKLKTKYVHA